MSASDPIGPAPETRSVRFRRLLFGASAAPLAWLGHVMLGYGVTAIVCYPGDHPQTLPQAGALFAALLIFDVIALALCAAGAAVSWRIWRQGTQLVVGRVRFLAIWGLLSSLWFFIAILFNVIASVAVPPCIL